MTCVIWVVVAYATFLSFCYLALLRSPYRGVSAWEVREVMEVADGQQLIGWHYTHRAPGAFNPELPLAQRRLMPEWAHLRTQQRASQTGDGRPI